MKATRGDDDGQVNNPKPHIKKQKWNYLPTHFSKEPAKACKALRIGSLKRCING